MKAEANGLAGEDAIKRMFSAAKGGNWAEAAAAYKDFHVIVNDELEGPGNDETEGPKPKEKRPLAAILIGGPAKK